MSNQMLYHGPGRILRQVTGPTGNQVADSMQEETGDNGYTEWYAANQGVDTILHGKLEGIGAGNITVQKASGQFDTNYDDFEVIDVTGKYQFDWSAGQPLAGQFRLFNESGADVVFYGNTPI